MPTGTQPYTQPSQDQTLSQYLASLGNLGSVGAENAAGQEYNTDATDPGYVSLGTSTPSVGGDVTSLANSQTSPLGFTEIPGPTNTAVASDVAAPSTPSWWENLISYGIPLAAGAGLGDAILGPAAAATGSGITDASLGELGINTGLDAGLPGAAYGPAATTVGADAGSLSGADLLPAGGTTPDLATLTGDAAGASPFSAPATNTEGLLDTSSAFSNAYSGASPATVNAFTNPAASGPTFDSTGLINNSLLPSDVGEATAGAGGGGNGFDLSSILSTAKSMGVSPLSALSLLGSILAKPKTPNIPQLTDIAQTTQANAAALGGTEATDLAAGQTGKLPAGAQGQINQAEQSAEAAIKSKYAAMGLSGSTMEQQDLISAQNAAVAAQFNEAQTLANQGVQIAGVINSGDATSAQIYETIMQTVLQQDQALQSALANFASSSALGAAIANRNTGGS